MGIQIISNETSNGRSGQNPFQNSGGMFYGTAPSGWTSYTHPLYPTVVIKAKQILSSPAALTAGITPNIDNIAATFTALMTTKGNTGDTCVPVVTVIGIGGIVSTVNLCTYTVATADSTIALQGAALASSINANTYLNGWSATFLTATLTLIAPTSQGIYPNTSAVPTFTITGAMVFAAAALGISGTASIYADAYYQISEYYRINPTGNLWIGFIATSSSFQEILALNLASGNTLRNMWIADTNATRGAVANLLATTQSIQAIVNNISSVNPVEILYRPNIAAVTTANLSTLPNGQLNTNTNNVQVIISQDGLAQGRLLFSTSGWSISNVGAKLGTQSKLRISGSDAQPIQQNNVSNGIENNTPAISNGTLISAISVSLFQQLFGTSSTNTSGYGYIGFIQYPGNATGTYWTGNSMFVSGANRFAYMNDNQVWDQVTRIIQATYIPQINAEITYDSTGNISSSSIGYLQNLGIAAITSGMITGINPPYISGTPIVTIAANQNVNATNTLNISVGTAENGIIRNIVVTNGFTN